MADKILSSLSRYSFLAGAAVLGANTCLYNVDAGHRAVLFDNVRGGIQEVVKAEGTHFIVPIIQSPRIIEVRTRPKELPSITGTKDLQTVQIKLRVLWRPEIDKLPEIYRKFQDQLEDRVLPSIGNEVLKSVVAQYNASELLSKRAEVSNRIRDELTKRAASFNIIFDDVAITHLNFGVEYMRAIESKQVAQQEAEKQLYVVELAEQIRQATVIRAEGEAESAQLITKAVEKHGEGILEMKRIDAAKSIATTLARSGKVTYLPGGGGGGGGGGGPGLLMSIDK
jgi:prohibitin 1